MKKKENINQILLEYFNTIKMLLKFEENDVIKDLCSKVLNHILQCVGGSNLLLECTGLIENTSCIKTLGDAVALDLEDDIDSNKSFIFSLKAKILNDEKIKNLTSFDQDIFIDELTKSASNGDIYSCKLLAILNELGLIVDKNFDTAKLIYKMISYTGDLYSLYYLINITKKNKDENKVLKDVFDLYLKHQSLFIPVLNNDLAINYSEDVKGYVELILCNKNRIKNKKLELAEVVFLYYLVITNDDLDTKLSNICNISNDGYCLVLREKHFKNKKYGF